MNPTLGAARQWAQLVLGRAEPGSQTQRRNLRLLQASLADLGVRAIGVVVGLLAVPLTVGLLGAERYGVWITMSTVLNWLGMADLGLANGLTTALSRSQAEGQPDRAQSYVSTTFWALTAVAGGMGLIGLFAWPWIDWAALFNAHSAQARAEIGTAMALALAIFLGRFPLAILLKIYVAYQEGATANYWAAAGTMLSLVALIAVTRRPHELAWLVVAASGSLLLASLVNALWLFGWKKPWLRPRPGAIRKEVWDELAGAGGRFFVVQMAALLLLQTDNVIIAQCLGPEQVTRYNVAWRFFSYTTLLQLIISPYLWPAYAEAFAQGDRGWIRRTFRLNLLVTTGAALLLSLPLVLWGRPLVRLLAGEVAVPPSALLVWMAAWSVIYASMSAVVCLLNASGHLRGQTLYGTLTAVVNVALSIALAPRFGITGVMAATVVAYVFCSIVPASWEAKGVLRRLGPAAVPAGGP